MISSILVNTLSIKIISTGNEDYWIRFCNDALKNKVSCILDVGAILVGRSM